MGQVARPYELVRDLLGLDQRLRNSEILTGGRRWGPQEPWNYFGQVGQPALLSPWSAPSLVSGVHQPRWQRDEHNEMHLSGAVVKTDADPAHLPIAFPPPGLGPPQPKRWAAACNLIPLYHVDMTGWVQQVYLFMMPGGPLTLHGQWANYSGEHLVSLEGISWSIT